jgi:hypothetical protein
MVRQTDHFFAGEAPPRPGESRFLAPTLGRALQAGFGRSHPGNRQTRPRPALVKAAVDRGGAEGFHKLTGSWPGD